MTAGGDAGCSVGKGQHFLQLENRQSMQIAVLGKPEKEGSEKGVACPIGIANLAGNTGNLAGMSLVPVE